MSDDKNYGTGLFTRKRLILLFVPLFFEQLLAVTISLLDTVMVSSVGEAAVSGVSLISPIHNLCVNLFAAFTTGGTIITSQYLGSGDRENANKTAKQIYLSVISVALIIMTVCLLFNKPIINTVFGKIEADVAYNSSVYFYFIACVLPLEAVYSMSAALFRVMGNSKISMFSSLLKNILNLCGNAVLIPKMGVAGAGLSTLLSILVGTVIMVVLIRNPMNTVYVNDFFKLNYNFPLIKKIVFVGLPNGIESASFQIGKIAVASVVSSLGTPSITANAIVSQIALISSLPVGTANLGVVSVIGRCIGAGDIDKAKKYIKRMCFICYVALSLSNMVPLFFLKPILGIFNAGEEAMSIVQLIMPLYAIMSIICYTLSFFMPSALRATGDTRYPMIVSMCSILFRVLLTYAIVLLTDIGLLGVWIAIWVDWVIRSALFVGRFVSGKWKDKKVI